MLPRTAPREPESPPVGTPCHARVTDGRGLGPAGLAREQGRENWLTTLQPPLGSLCLVHAVS